MVFDHPQAPNPKPNEVTFVDPRDDKQHVGIIGFGFPGKDHCGSAFLGNSWDLGLDGIQLSAKCPVTSISELKGFRNAEAAFQALTIWSEANQFKFLSGQQALQFKMQFQGVEDWTYGGYGSDWSGMFAVLRAKFSQNEACREALLKTGDAFLVEHNIKDKLWSNILFGNGINWLGLQLMLIRDDINGDSNRESTWTYFIEQHCGIDLKTGNPREGIVENRWLATVQSAISATLQKLQELSACPIEQHSIPGIAMPGQPCASPEINVPPTDLSQEEPEVRRVKIRIPVNEHVPPLSMTHPVEQCVTRNLYNPSLKPAQGVKEKTWWNTVFYMPETVENVKPLLGCRRSHRGGVGGEANQGVHFTERFVKGPDDTWIDHVKVQRMNTFYANLQSEQDRVQRELEMLEMEKKQLLEDQTGNVINHVVKPLPSFVCPYTKSPLFVYHDQYMTAQEIWHHHGLWVDESKFRENDQHGHLPCELPMPSWPFSTGPGHNPYRREAPMSMTAYEGSRDDLPAEQYTKPPNFFDKGFMSLIDRIF